jgi:hypothetical protein
MVPIILDVFSPLKLPLLMWSVSEVFGLEPDCTKRAGGFRNRGSFFTISPNSKLPHFSRDYSLVSSLQDDSVGIHLSTAEFRSRDLACERFICI